eukprot:scaffold1525_cov254-Pinguiococcus_pyrenoidosus.AAC.1
METDGGKGARELRCSAALPAWLSGPRRSCGSAAHRPSLAWTGLGRWARSSRWDQRRPSTTVSAD